MRGSARGSGRGSPRGSHRTWPRGASRAAARQSATGREAISSAIAAKRLARRARRPRFTVLRHRPGGLLVRFDARPRGAASPSAPAAAAMSRCHFPATGSRAAAFPPPAADGSPPPRVCAGAARTIFASTTTSVGPPISTRCSTLSRRTRTSSPARVDAGVVDDGEPRLAAAGGRASQPTRAEPTHSPGGGADQQPSTKRNAKKKRTASRHVRAEQSFINIPLLPLISGRSSGFPMVNGRRQQLPPRILTKN